MPVKITLEDGREFHVGQEIEILQYGANCWMRGTVRMNMLESIVIFPERYRAIAPKVNRPMTAKEVWSLLQTGVEWRRNSWGAGFAIGGDVITEYGGSIVISTARHDISVCTYRTAPDQPWQKFEVEE